MILEAFSIVLRQGYCAENTAAGPTAMDILHHWLRAILSKPFPEGNVEKVIHAEISMLCCEEQVAFMPRSRSGESLLKTLYYYCESYEQWQFNRWLHHVKPHYFNRQLS